jgi:Spy/CpxP family protein refolding chaperone
MKNLKTGTMAILLTALILVSSQDIFAQRGNSNNAGKGYFCDNIPGITEDQKAKIAELRTAHWKAMQDNRNQLAEKRAHLQTLRSAEKPDMNAINKTIDEISTIQSTMMKSSEKHIQDVRNLLTEEQRVHFDQFRGSRGHGNCGRGNGNGPGKGCGRAPGSGNCQYRGSK